ncbi:MAG: hypothetical protein U1E65_34660 [Myxococcota bacterium]
MVTVKNPPEVMAPWFSALVAVEADKKVTKKEVETKLAPWQDQVDGSTKSNPFQSRLIDLVADKEASAKATPAAKQSIAQILAGAKINGSYHHTVGVSDVSWSYGMGIHPPPGSGIHFGGPSINMMVQTPYIDVTPKAKVKVDEKTRTITVSIEGRSAGKFHPMTLAGEGGAHPLVAVGPKPFSIDVKRPKQLGKEYKIVVVDASPASAKPGQVLATGSFSNMLPM